MNNQKSETVQQVSIPWEGETWKARGPKNKSGFDVATSTELPNTRSASARLR